MCELYYLPLLSACTVEPWWMIAGFESADDMPLVPTTSLEQKCLEVEVEDAKHLQALVMRSKVDNFEELLEGLTFNCDTFTEWLVEAETCIRCKQWELEVS